jgi:hypothetical protein
LKKDFADPYCYAAINNSAISLIEGVDYLIDDARQRIVVLQSSFAGDKNFFRLQDRLSQASGG